MTTMTDWLGLQGKIAAITGGGGGIGRAVALGMAKQGVTPVLLDRDMAGCDQTLAVLRLVGVEARAIACDIADPESVRVAAEQAGPVDILVNNAGILRPGPLASLSLAEWNLLLSVNLSGYFLCAQAFGAGMRERGKGAMVHIASIASRFPQAASGAYSVSKAGVVMLSQQIALEWGPLGVRSNVVSPGLVRTPMSEAFYQAEGVAGRRAKAVPLGRVATPDDIAEVVIYLASERAGYVNGEDVCVDGGFGRTTMSTVPRPGFE
jgi:NAD(P)-dependent dehydrogenase (short-subunit alcohol dehydrogenase family)